MDCKRMVLMELHVRILYMDHFTHQRQLARKLEEELQVIRSFKIFDPRKYEEEEQELLHTLDQRVRLEDIPPLNLFRFLDLI
jgi:hypothetical protein